MATVKKEPTKQPDQETTKEHYQEWDVKVEKGEAVKLKISRQCVKITDEQAETLNHGRLSGGNTYVKMYFKK